MPVLSLAIKSLRNRRFTAGLVLLSIALSVLLLIGVERLRVESRMSFANTLSGTDLIVGARSSAINLLLYSVFRIGDATNNISWKSYQKLAANRLVDWTVPLSLGDSHKGFRVLGTSAAYFQHYRYADKQPLTLAEGVPFSGVHEAVLGAEVARQLGYTLKQKIIIAHGTGKVSFIQHDQQPFTVVGILNPTGTPVDRTIHISLQGMTAIHKGWIGGRQIPGRIPSAEDVLKMDLTPKDITAFLVGLKSKIATFRVQREINNYRGEPLQAILPGVALQQLWDTMSIAETALLLITSLVVVIGLLGMLTVMLAGLQERRREMAILRSVGAQPRHILLLITGESVVLALSGILIGMILLYAGLLIAQPYLSAHYGLHLPITWPAQREWQILGVVGISAVLVGLIPGYRAYRQSLSDGMNIRL